MEASFTPYSFKHYLNTNIAISSFDKRLIKTINPGMIEVSYNVFFLLTSWLSVPGSPTTSACDRGESGKRKIKCKTPFLRVVSVVSTT
tara:strand:- start:954 stop:1217 length:264 start_codon:yes stop_codon:yes gene_type:complete